VIVGLGNPGIKYSETRHNIGYKVVEKLAEKKKLKFEKVSKNFALAKGETENSVFSLLLPLTYMNLSGLAVKEFIHI
jgi:peptidyl-tRNA hydrolase (EC 3.1.1.29)